MFFSQWIFNQISAGCNFHCPFFFNFIFTFPPLSSLGPVWMYWKCNGSPSHQLFNQIRIENDLRPQWQREHSWEIIFNIGIKKKNNSFLPQCTTLILSKPLILTSHFFLACASSVTFIMSVDPKGHFNFKAKFKTVVQAICADLSCSQCHNYRTLVLTNFAMQSHTNKGFICFCFFWQSSFLTFKFVPWAWYLLSLMHNHCNFVPMLSTLPFPPYLPVSLFLSTFT